MARDRISQDLTLPDGRTLAFAEWGDPEGKPVFHFHGSSSSRLENPLLERSLAGVRLVTVDRPGHGLSDFQSKRRLLDWPKDVVALADHLNIARFGVSGWSFGGPYAIACANAIPERLTAVGLVSSFAPYDRPKATTGMARFNRIALALARWTPYWMVRQFMNVQARALVAKPEETAKRMLSSVPEADREILSDRQATEMLLPAMSEAYRNGANGAAWEAALLVRPWVFRLQDITIPVEIWQGEADVNAPLQCAEYLRDTIPNTHLTVFPGEGHFLILQRWEEILAFLTSRP